jgi:hypothetical protein
MPKTAIVTCGMGRVMAQGLSEAGFGPVPPLRCQAAGDRPALPPATRSATRHRLCRPDRLALAMPRIRLPASA